MADPSVSVTGQSYAGDPPAMWSLGMPPEVMTSFLVNLLRQHFSDASNVVDPAFRDRIWLADAGRPGKSDPASPIAIDSIDVWDPALVGIRPAIIVKDHAWTPIRAGIADVNQGFYAADGSDTYTCTFRSSNTAFGVANEPLEAKRLATEVARELVQFSEEIRRHCGLTRFVVVERGECFTLEESRQHFGVPVTVAYEAQGSWTIRKQGPAIRKVLLSIHPEFPQQ